MTCLGASGVGWKVREFVHMVGQEIEGMDGDMEALNDAMTIL